MMGAGHEAQQISQQCIVKGVSGRVAQTYRRLRQEELFELKGQPGIYSEFQVNLNSKLYLKKEEEEMYCNKGKEVDWKLHPELCQVTLLFLLKKTAGSDIPPVMVQLTQWHSEIPSLPWYFFSLKIIFV